MYKFLLHGKKLSLAITTFCLLAVCVVPVRAQSKVTTIPLPGTPGQIAVNPISGLAYVPLTGIGEVAIIDEASKTLLRTISVGTDPDSAAVDPLTSKLYVADPFTGTLYVLDTHTDTVLASISVPAVDVAINIATNTIYVSDFGSNIYVIDGATNMVRTTIAVNALAFIAVNPATNRIYDATGDPNHGQVIVVDGNTDQVLTTINFVGSTTSYVGVDPVRNLIYASNASSVAVINGATNTVLKKIKLPGTPADVSINPVTRLVYVANNALNEVQVIDGTTNTLTKTAIPVGNGPDFTAIDIYRGLLLVANSSEGIGVAPGGPSVSIISLSQ